MLLGVVLITVTSFSVIVEVILVPTPFVEIKVATEVHIGWSEPTATTHVTFAATSASLTIEITLLAATGPIELTRILIHVHVSSTSAACHVHIVSLLTCLTRLLTIKVVVVAIS